MKEEIKELLEKHKDFVKQITNELIKENDDFGNARRLEDYLKELKAKKIKNKSEKIAILDDIATDFAAKDAHQKFLYEMDEPRRYLEQTYPIFYKYFSERYERFWNNWMAIINRQLKGKFKESLFQEFCRKINLEIEDSTNYKETVIEIENIGGPEKMQGKINFTRDLFFQLIDELFELQELIIASFGHENDELETIQKLFIGNRLEKRKSKNLNKYNKTAKLIGIMETDYKYLTGIQTKACEMTDCDSKSFSKWINDNKYNNKLFHYWKKTIEDEEKIDLKKEIEAYIKK